MKTHPDLKLLVEQVADELEHSLAPTLAVSLSMVKILNGSGDVLSQEDVAEIHRLIAKDRLHSHSIHQLLSAILYSHETLRCALMRASAPGMAVVA